MYATCLSLVGFAGRCIDGPGRTCHQPHGSHNDKMLTAKLPMLCQRCHMNGGHNNSAYDRSQISNRTNRLANKSCVNCHSNIHGSNHPSGKFFVR